ncbi:MAG: septum formation initiator family protein [Candidatus Omnitrophota bacterium]|nr:septum formation initiator family protein [Candidatus Omnitrophota bacterium]
MLSATIRKAFWILGLGVFLLMLFLPGYSKLQELKDKNRELEVKIKRLKIDNALMDQELKLLENDPVYQEKIAREKLGVVKKGEIPIKVLPQRKK